MKKRDLIVPFILVLAGSTSIAHARKAGSTEATGVGSYCNSVLAGVMNAAAGENASDDEDKSLKFMHVKILSSHPCGGGSDECTVDAMKGEMEDDSFKATFRVTSGRGNCSVQSIDLKSK